MFKNIHQYTRLILRRERMASPIWIVCIVGFTAAVASLYPSLFPDKDSLLAMALTMDTPAMRAMMGPVYGLDRLTTAMVMSQECLVYAIMPLAIMNILYVNRHTRRDEERGRTELLMSLPVGRLAGTFSTIVSVGIIDICTSLLIAVSLIAVNIPGTTAGGAFTFGFVCGAASFVFAGITLLFAQLFSTAHGVGGSVFAIFLISFMMRAVGDMRENALSYISPLGLGLRTYAFDENKIYPILILFAEALLLVGISVAICSVRDHGQGVFPAKKGRKNAGIFLRNELGLSWRLSRNMMLAWLAGSCLIGLCYGAVIPELDQFLEKSEMMAQMVQTDSHVSMLDNYISMICMVVSMIGTVPVIMIANKLRSEEKRGRLDLILSKAVSKSGLLLSYIAISTLCSILFPILAAISLYMGAGAAADLHLPGIIQAGCVYIPAMWVMLGISVFLMGAWPKLSGLIWVYLGYSFFVLYFGRIADLDKVFAKLSPFGSVPQIPTEEFQAAPLAVMVVVSVMLVGIGVDRFRRRDIG